jgi:hypothetical protein
MPSAFDQLFDEHLDRYDHASGRHAAGDEKLLILILGESYRADEKVLKDWTE